MTTPRSFAGIASKSCNIAGRSLAGYLADGVIVATRLGESPSVGGYQQGVRGLCSMLMREMAVKKAAEVLGVMDTRFWRARRLASRM
jgi:hypothetical protein